MIGGELSADLIGLCLPPRMVMMMDDVQKTAAGVRVINRWSFDPANVVRVNVDWILLGLRLFLPLERFASLFPKFI